MIKNIGLILFGLVLSPALVWGQALERTVKLEWEGDNEAQTYQVEIGRKGTDKPLQSFSDLGEPRWMGLLKPGHYWMRVRGRDDRGIPGEWGDKSPFVVKFGFAAAESPAYGELIKSSLEQGNVTLKWRPIPNVSGYSVTVLSEDGQVVSTQKVAETQTTLSLAAARKYLWFVQGVDEEGIAGESPEEKSQFTLQGPKIQPVQVKKPESNFVRLLEFKKPAEAQGIKVQLLWFDAKEQKWTLKHEAELKNTDKMRFLGTWPGGKYQVLASNLAGYREFTPPTELLFDVATGSRSIAAENRALIRKSLDRSQDSFVTASYILSQITYSAQVVSENRNVSFSALTGTANAGYGRFFEDSRWGYFASLGFGGIALDGANHTFLETEALALYRMSPSKDSDLQLKGGLFFQQLPEVKSAQVSTELANINFLGPQLSAEYWRALTPKWAVQGNTTLRLPQGGKSARGSAVSASSQQFGLQGSYRYSSAISLLLGYSYKLEKFSFPDTNPGLAVSGTTTTDLSGHYIKLSFEYDL